MSVGKSRVSMATRSIDCPLCPEQAQVFIEDQHSVYLIKGYTEDPTDEGGFFSRAPKPESILGTELYVDHSTRSVTLARCEDGHYLRIFSAHYTSIPQDKVISPPDFAPNVECPYCKYEFGTQEEFIFQPGKEDDQKTLQVLRSVNATPHPAFEEINGRTKKLLLKHPRVAQRVDCPHCGNIIYFQYQQRGDEELGRNEVEPVKIEEVF